MYFYLSVFIGFIAGFLGVAFYDYITESCMVCKSTKTYLYLVKKSLQPDGKQVNLQSCTYEQDKTNRTGRIRYQCSSSCILHEIRDMASYTCIECHENYKSCKCPTSWYYNTITHHEANKVDDALAKNQ